eukprot:m.12193 g.12193  ORF g.12193 m.12193 type:complete len:147 (+) comp9908_c0_seq1:368-808(+)
MGDTITHLESADQVHSLLQQVATTLKPGGNFLMSWRDLSTPLHGSDRFLPVRATDSQIMTCFLEWQPITTTSKRPLDFGVVSVTELIHRKQGADWDLAKSSYNKLILPDQKLTSVGNSYGFALLHGSSCRGMLLKGWMRLGDQVSP